MSDIGDGIISGLNEAISYMKGTGDRGQFIEHKFAPVCQVDEVDVKAIREKLGLTQSGFASAFGLSLYALRNWEQGKRKPDPAARAYLKVISFAPETVRKALAG